MSIFNIFSTKEICDGKPPLKDRYINFVRYWNDKLYKTSDSTLIYRRHNNFTHVYKHESGDYFSVCYSPYGDWDYSILSKDKMIQILLNDINSYNFEYINKLLQNEFNYNLK